VLVSTLKLIVSGGFSIKETSFPSQGKILFSHGVFLSLRKVFREIRLLIQIAIERFGARDAQNRDLVSKKPLFLRKAGYFFPTGVF
jgi:hypothetical protein